MHGIGKRKLLCNIMKDTRFTVKKQCEKMQDCQCKSKLKKRCLPRTMTSSDVMRVSRMSDIKKTTAITYAGLTEAADYLHK